MRLRRLSKAAVFIFALLVALLFSTTSFGQASNDKAASSASITFTLDFPGSDPEHYFLSVDSDGHASYESSAKIAQSSEEHETYRTEFAFSPANRARIFDLAAQAHYFSGKVDSGKKLAFTGAKKLVYQDGQRNVTANYNYSMQPAVQQLTAFFQSVSATLEFGRHLTYFHRYQKLALDEELKQMESQAKENQLGELQAVHSILQDILDDTSVINVVRARAKFLMEMANNSSTSGH